MLMHYLDSEKQREVWLHIHKIAGEFPVIIMGTKFMNYFKLKIVTIDFGPTANVNAEKDPKDYPTLTRTHREVFQ